MNKKITLNNLSEFHKKENEMSQFLYDLEDSSFFPSEKASESVISNILAFSKAISIRESKSFGNFSFILN